MTETLGGILTDDYLRAKANEAAERLILSATGYRYDYTSGRWVSTWWWNGPAVKAVQTLDLAENIRPEIGYYEPDGFIVRHR